MKDLKKMKKSELIELCEKQTVEIREFNDYISRDSGVKSQFLQEISELEKQISFIKNRNAELEEKLRELEESILYFEDRTYRLSEILGERDISDATHVLIKECCCKAEHIMMMLEKKDQEIERLNNLEKSRNMQIEKLIQDNEKLNETIINLETENEELKCDLEYKKSNKKFIAHNYKRAEKMVNEYLNLGKEVFLLDGIDQIIEDVVLENKLLKEANNEISDLININQELEEKLKKADEWKMNNCYNEAELEFVIVDKDEEKKMLEYAFNRVLKWMVEYHKNNKGEE